MSALTVFAIACDPPLSEPVPPNQNSITFENPVGLDIPQLPIRSTLDNPELRTLIDLSLASAPRDLRQALTIDSLVPSIDAQNIVTPGHVSFAPGKLQVVTTGGDGATDDNGLPLSIHAAAIEDSLTPWPENTSTLRPPANADLFARGLRLGYTGVDVQVRRTTGHGGTVTLASRAVELDSNVALVPVSVVAIQTEGHHDYGGLGSVQGNLAAWDQVPYFFETEDTESDGAVALTSYAFSEYFGSSSWQPIAATPAWTPFQGYTADGNIVPCSPLDAACGPKLASDSSGNSYYFTPDSIWRDCGVQYRLVQFTKLFIRDADCQDKLDCAERLNNNILGVDLATVCGQLVSIVNNRLGTVNLPTIVVNYSMFSSRAAPAEFGNTNVLGGAAPVACVSHDARQLNPPVGGNQARYTLAHELGHWAGLDDCDPLSSSCEFMNSNFTTAPPTPAECAAVHSWATTQFGKFWPR